MNQRYRDIRQRTVSICEPLSVEDHLMQPVVDVSPPKWHLAHTTWFFETFVLVPHKPDYTLFHPNFPFYFNSYYQSLGERQQRDHRGWLTRPSLEEVMKYRDHVDRHMTELLSGDTGDVPWLGLVEIGLQHEQQHQELLWTDIKYGLASQPFHPIYSKKPIIPDGTDSLGLAAEWISIPEGKYAIGYDGDGFAFDNEYARHEVWLSAYSIASQPVSNEEYMQFIADEGYKRFELWHDEGWKWVCENRASYPLYWERSEGPWKHFTLSGLQELNPHATVQHINYYEAAAFARWAGCRLPTEFEWEAAAEQMQWGQRWEWTNSAYLPYPGYRIPDGAVGEYNGKFMVNQMVLRGASIATSPNHSRKTYRNFFHPQHQWQFTGLRLAKD